MDEEQLQFVRLAESTKESRNMTCKRWNTEYASAEKSIPRLEDVTSKQLNSLIGPNKTPFYVVLFEGFCNVLLNMRYLSDPSKFLAVGTLKILLSGAKNILEKKFPRIRALQSNAPESDWYKSLYHSFLLRAYEASIRRGDSVEETERFIRSELLELVLTEWLKKNTPTSMLYRALASLLYMAVGRAGEAAYVNLGAAAWDNGLFLPWGKQRLASSREWTFHRMQPVSFCASSTRSRRTALSINESCRSRPLRNGCFRTLRKLPKVE